MSIIYHKRYKIFTEHVHLLSKNNLLKSLLNCSSRLEKKNLKLRSWKTLPFHSVQKISYISFCFYTFPESDSCERDRLQFQFDQSQVWCEELRYKQNSRTLSYLGMTSWCENYNLIHVTFSCYKGGSNDRTVILTRNSG